MNGVVIEHQEAKKLKIRDNTYETTPEIQIAQTQTNINFKKMSDDDLVNIGYILNDINYDPNTNLKSKRQEYIKNNLSSRLE